MELFIVGQNLDYEAKLWELSGVFDSKEKAIAACRDENYWWAKVNLNEQFPHETCQFEEYGYPKA